MAADNPNVTDKVEAQSLKQGEGSSLSSAIDFKAEQKPLAFKQESSDSKLSPDFQLDFGKNDIYSSSLGEYGLLSKPAPALDLNPKGKAISFDVGEVKVASSQNGDSAATVVKDGSQDAKSAETVVKDGSQDGKSAETIVKDGSQDAKSAETVVKDGSQDGKSAETVVKDGSQDGKSAETVAKDGSQDAKSAETVMKTVEFPPHPVQDKETYWSIARDHLKDTGGHDPSDTEVMNYMKKLAKHNGLTLEQAAHIDHNDVVHFPPEKQASVVSAEKAPISKDNGSDSKGEAVVGKDNGSDGKGEAVVGKDNGSDSKGEAQIQAGKTQAGSDVVVPLNLFPDDGGDHNQPKVEVKQPETEKQEQEHQPETQPEVNPSPKNKPQPTVVEADSSVKPQPVEKFEPTDFTV